MTQVTIQYWDYFLKILDKMKSICTSWLSDIDGKRNVVLFTVFHITPPWDKLLQNFFFRQCQPPIWIEDIKDYPPCMHLWYSNSQVEDLMLYLLHCKLHQETRARFIMPLLTQLNQYSMKEKKICFLLIDVDDQGTK